MEIRRVGLRALLVEVASPEEARAFAAEVARRRADGALPPIDEVVPGERTVLLDGLDEPARLAATLASWQVPPLDPQEGPLVEIPIRYDGPDLADVARLWGVTEPEVGPIHSRYEYRVAFCGFTPGFAYLTGLPERLRVPRRPEARPVVPAGSVALASRFTGIYPRPTPGGWQLLGHTDVPLFDPDREPAALLAPGTRVRFRILGG